MKSLIRVIYFWIIFYQTSAHISERRRFLSYNEKYKYSVHSTGVPWYPDFLRSSDAPLGIPMNHTSTGMAFNETANFDRWWNVLRKIHYQKDKSLTIVFLGGNLKLTFKIIFSFQD